MRLLSNAPNRQSLLKKIMELQKNRQSSTSQRSTSLARKQRFTKEDMQGLVSKQVPLSPGTTEALSGPPEIHYNEDEMRNYKQFGVRVPKSSSHSRHIVISPFRMSMRTQDATPSGVAENPYQMFFSSGLTVTAAV